MNVQDIINLAQSHCIGCLFAAACFFSLLAAFLALVYMAARAADAEKKPFAPELAHIVGLLAVAACNGIEAVLNFV